jgi:hypothetical protein
MDRPRVAGSLRSTQRGLLPFTKEGSMPSIEKMPNEWLLFLAAHRDAHQALLRETGSLILAAWRLAWARCRTSGVATTVPSMIEVRGAAREISRRLGLRESIPSAAQIARECADAGLLVI